MTVYIENPRMWSGRSIYHFWRRKNDYYGYNYFAMADCGCGMYAIDEYDQVKWEKKLDEWKIIKHFLLKQINNML